DLIADAAVRAVDGGGVDAFPFVRNIADELEAGDLRHGRPHTISQFEVRSSRFDYLQVFGSIRRIGNPSLECFFRLLGSTVESPRNTVIPHVTQASPSYSLRSWPSPYTLIGRPWPN